MDQAVAAATPHFVLLDANRQPINVPGTPHVAVYDKRTGLDWLARYVVDGRLDQRKAIKAAAAVREFGVDDWHLPDVEPLFLLCDRTRFDPAIDPIAFPFIKSGWHWTRTPWADSPESSAWVCGLDYGSACGSDRDYNGFVLACRAAPAPGQ